MSIRQEQLRIGNWVLDEGKPVTVDGLQFTGRIVTQDNSYDDFKRGINPDPIILTVEIIESCGFVKKDFGLGYYTNLFFIYLPGSPDSDYGFGIKGIGLIRSVKYLHELQNLCYILSGDELEINLL